jgi:hypothetical protein
VPHTKLITPSKQDKPTFVSKAFFHFTPVSRIHTVLHDEYGQSGRSDTNENHKSDLFNDNFSYAYEKSKSRMHTKTKSRMHTKNDANI